MKKIFTIAIIGAALLPLAFCGQQRPETTTTLGGTTATTVGTTATTLSRFDDTAWQNVLATLKQCLKAEQANSNPATKLDAGKALVLAAKFMKVNMSETRYGFQRSDIDLYVQRAKMMFEAVINDPSASSSQRAEAKSEEAKLSAI